MFVEGLKLINRARFEPRPSFEYNPPTIFAIRVEDRLLKFYKQSVQGETQRRELSVEWYLVVHSNAEM